MDILGPLDSDERPISQEKQVWQQTIRQQAATRLSTPGQAGTTKSSRSEGQRTLAAALFVIASGAIARTNGAYQQHFSLPSGRITPAALLSAARLTDGAPFPSEGPPPKASVLVAQSFVNLGTP